MLFYFTEEQTEKLINLVKNSENLAYQKLHSKKGSQLSEEVTSQIGEEIAFCEGIIAKLKGQ